MGICSYQLVLDKIMFLKEDFMGHNAELIAMIIETCGKYLLKNEESTKEFSPLLEGLWRLKDTVNSKSIARLEDAILGCKN